MTLPTKDVRGVRLCMDPAREACFTVVNTDAEMEDWPGMEGRAARERLHRHMNNETVALEIAAQCLVDFADAPWGLRMQLARQASDEARHAMALYRRLCELGGRKGEFPVANFEWGVTGLIDDLPGRLAVQNRTFEAGLIDLLGSLRARWREAGDDRTADLLDSILADEIGHVRFANRWIRQLTEQNPGVLLQVARAIRFLATTTARLAPSDGETNAAGTSITGERLLPPAVNISDRLAAEFTENEILEVLRQAGFRSIIPPATEQKQRLGTT
jgi:bacterioferritin (cytochrome b1)